jgi:hypothetical protein
MAQQPTIVVNDGLMVRGRPTISIEIVGENLGLVVMYHHSVSQTRNLLYLYDWKRGTMKMVCFKGLVISFRLTSAWRNRLQSATMVLFS